MVGFFSFANILRPLWAESIAESVEHGVHAVRLELVLECLEVLLAAREDLFVHR